MTDLHLHATSLFSKWGFGDGDIVDEWYWDTFDGPIPNGISHHDVLIELVRKVLVPAIETAGHRIDVYEIDTIHNPIRARYFDDVDVPDGMIYGDIDEPTWAEEISVTITPAQIRELTA